MRYIWDSRTNQVTGPYEGVLSWYVDQLNLRVMVEMGNDWLPDWQLDGPFYLKTKGEILGMGLEVPE